MRTNDSDEATGQADLPAGLVRVTAEEAQTLVKQYIATTETPAVPVQAVSLDLIQLAAMNELVAENPSLLGFRVYFGRETGGAPVSIVVGIDARNADLASRSIYKTLSAGSGPCPPNCDRESPISPE
jgi:hypothetical protein